MSRGLVNGLKRERWLEVFEESTIVVEANMENLP
jgi:hypothetical protein